MKNEFPFDDFIRGQLNSYTPEVPERIWNNIVAERNTKPKGFWLNWLNAGNILLVTLILITAGVGYYFIASPKDKFNIAAQKNEHKKDQDQVNLNAENNNKVDPPVLNEKNTVVLAQDENTINSNDLLNKEYSSNTNTNQSAKTKDQKIRESDLFSSQNIIGANNASLTNDLTKLLFPFSFANAREIENTQKVNKVNVKLPDCPTIEKNAAGNKKYWELYAGPDYVFDNYKTYGDTASNNYLQKRKASTKFASAFSAGVRYTKVFNNGMSVRSGVNYSQVNEKFIYFNPNEIKYITVITTRVVIRSPGDTLYINDTLQYQQSGARTKTTYNRYRNIDIPLVIGYELGNGKIHANINAGVIINIYSWYKGDMLDTTYQPVSITTGKGNKQYQYKNNIGVGFLGSISMYYKLNDQMHLVLEPYFRYNLSPMSNNNSNLQQRFHTTGIRAGIRLDLK